MSNSRIQLAALFTAALASTGVTAAQSTATGLKLIPIPREIAAAGIQPLSSGIQINCASPCTAEDSFAIVDLKEWLSTVGIQVNTSAPVSILVVRYGTAQANAIYAQSATPDGSSSPQMSDEMKPEGYAISPDGKGLGVTASTGSGIFYGLQTVKQLITGSGTTAVLHQAKIRDWPAMKYRGVSDDLSRGPVPTLAFQKKFIRTLAAYKVNLYSLYFEHTAAYTSNPLIAPPGGSITPAQAAELVDYARQFHITIVPEQEAFGHLHNLLSWEQYQTMAETPHGSVLAPGQPGSLALIKQEFTELAAQYPGSFLHIGADETVDLGLGQTKTAVDSQTLGAVYLDFMQQIVTALQPLKRRLLFWGDIAQDSPNLLKTLPKTFKDSTIAIAWVYNPDPRGYARFLTPFTAAGFETWVAPSVHNFRVVYPDNNYALANIQQFTRDGQRLGSTGQLNTIWNDDGEGLINEDWYGLLFGAAAAWQSGESSIDAFQQSYAQVFHGDATGFLNEAQKELMAAHEVLRQQAKVGDATDNIFWLDPWSKDGQKIADQVRPYTHDLRIHAEAALALIAQARAAAGPNPVPPPTMPETSTLYDAAVYGAASSRLREPDAVDAMELGARRMDFIGLKFQLADEMATAYARALSDAASTDRTVRAGVARDLTDLYGVNGRIQDIRNGYTLLRDLFESAWLRSNRPYWLRNNLEQYDYTVQVWLERGDKLHNAQRQWTDLKTLPPAAELGIPQPPSAAACCTPQPAPPAVRR